MQPSPGLFLGKLMFTLKYVMPAYISGGLFYPAISHDVRSTSEFTDLSTTSVAQLNKLSSQFFIL